MKKVSILKLLHLIYLGMLLTFIAFYFEVYQPLKLHDICAESSSKTVLSSTSNMDPFDSYSQNYKNCISQKSTAHLSLFTR